MPMMALACVSASAAVFASLTPPALPGPRPAWSRLRRAARGCRAVAKCPAPDTRADSRVLLRNRRSRAALERRQTVFEMRNDGAVSAPAHELGGGFHLGAHAAGPQVLTGEQVIGLRQRQAPDLFLRRGAVRAIHGLHIGQDQ